MDSIRKHSQVKRPVSPSSYSSLPPFSSTSSNFPHSSHFFISKKIFLWVLALFFLITFGAISFFVYKSLSLGHSIQIQNTNVSIFADMKNLAVSYFQNKHSALRGEENGRINILLLGRAGEHYPGKNLTDTVMLMSIDTASKKVALLSLPRDLYAPIPDTNLFTKINSLYQYGLSQNAGANPLRASVEEITGQKIHYFFILDFDGFEKIVGALGGISVDVVKDFYDPRYPGKNYSYETFEIKKGWQNLNGATALKYVRERHNDPEGDFGRAKRQQQIIQAIKDKAFSLGTFFNIFAINKMLDALGESVKTDMAIDEMESFLKLVRTLDTKNVTSVVVNAWQKESLLRVSHIQVGPTAAFILVPRVGNWSEINDLSENIFRLDALKERREKIAQEQATLAIFSSPENFSAAEKLKRVIAEMGFEKVSVTSSPALKNNSEQSIIVDRSGLQKPFSLDELIKRFALQKESNMGHIGFMVPMESDFVMIIGEDLVKKLSFDEESAPANSDDSFSEFLSPQHKK